MKPVLQALLLADHVYQDTRSGKKVIAGTFDTLGVFKYEEKQGEEPSEGGEIRKPLAAVQQAGAPYAYINVTDIRGETDLELRYVCLDSQEVLFRTTPPIRVNAKNPLDTLEVVVPVPMLPRQPGTYALELLWQDELLGSHRVIVREIQEPR